jgi:hypothetical protein
MTQQNKPNQDIEGIQLQQPAETPPSQDKESEDFREKMQEEMERQIEEIEKTFELNTRMDERANAIYRRLRQEQIGKIRGLFEKAKQEYETQGRLNVENRQQLASRLHDETVKETSARLENLKSIINKKAGKEIETHEVLEINKALKGLEELNRAHPEFKYLVEKIAKEQPLTKEDYQNIISLMKPNTIAEIKAKPVTMEELAPGMLISLMQPAQKYELVEQFMESPQANNTAELIDTLLSTGALNRYQGEKLFEKALQSGVLTQERFTSEFKERLENGYYEQQVNNLKELIQKELVANYKGVYNVNLIDRLVGMPLLGLLLSLWGGSTALFNGMANFEWRDPLGSISRFTKSIYGPVGLVAGVAGLEMTAGSLRTQQIPNKGVLEYTGIGYGWVSDVLRKIGEDDDVENEQKRRAVEQLSQIYLNSPKPFHEYLNNNGFTTIDTLRKQELANPNADKILNLDELIAAEQDPEQKSRLENLKKSPYFTDRDAAIKITSVPEAALALNITNEQKFQELVTQIRLKQTPHANN